MRGCFAVVTLASLAISSHTTHADSADAKPPVQIETTDLSIAPQTATNFKLAKLPERLKKLSGRKVVIHGYAFPPFENEVKTFVLTPETKGKPYVHSIYSASECPIEYVLTIHMKRGTTFNYWDNSRHPIRVTGRLELVPEKFEGVLYMLFSIQDAEIERAHPRNGYENSMRLGGC